ncbi:hypothetical protein [Methanimicrococcus stummii]|nr:hypothetical protein [Methanimicrococcus sp. Es2]
MTVLAALTVTEARSQSNHCTATPAAQPDGGKHDNVQTTQKIKKRKIVFN